MSSKMIGKIANVVGGRNIGLVGIIESDNAARRQYIIRIGRNAVSRGRLISAKYHLVTVVGVNGVVKQCKYEGKTVTAPLTELQKAKFKFECKAVTADLRKSLEISSPLDSNCGAMGAWVTLVYEEHGVIVANVVFKGEFAVVPIEYIKHYSGRPGSA